VVVLDKHKQPFPADVQVIIRSAGGEVLDKCPPSGGVIIVSTEELRTKWASHAAKPAVEVLNAADLLTCVMRQQLDMSNGKLS